MRVFWRMVGIARTAAITAVVASAALTAVFTSCGKGKGGGDVKLLESVSTSYEDGGLTQKFEYDGQNRLVKMYEGNVSDCNESTIIAYGAGDSITVKTVCEGAWEKEETFVRRGDKVERGFVIKGNGAESGSDTLTVNEDGYIVKDIPKNGNRTFQYRDGNLVCEDDENEACTYDDKKTPLSNSNTPKWLIHNLLGVAYVNKNNLLHEGDNYGRGTDHKYEYDGDGFPVERTTDWYNGEGDGGSNITVFTYRGGNDKSGGKAKNASVKAADGSMQSAEEATNASAENNAEPEGTSSGAVSTITVSTALEFKAALGSDRIIELKPGKYNISTWDPEVGDTPSELPEGVSWTDENGEGLTLTGIKNLTIRGAGSDKSGKHSELIVDPRNVNVLNFINCSGIVIENIVGGHSEGGMCGGGVFHFKESSRITVNGTAMYGSGTVGFGLEDVSGMKVTNSRIYECTDGIMSINGGKNIAFDKCTFDNNRIGTGPLLNVGADDTITYTDCVFKDNQARSLFFYMTPVVLSRCKLIGNEIKSVNDGNGYVKFVDCEFDNAVVDKRDGKAYKFVKIGNRFWTAENACYQTAKRSWCYKDQEYACVRYGKLYAWDAAKWACPSGWHLPTRKDVENMMDAVAGEKTEAAAYVMWNGAGKKLKTDSWWEKNSAGNDGGGIDAFGFAALPAGERVAKDGSYKGSEEFGTWWVDGSLTENGVDREMQFRLQLNRDDDAFFADGSAQKDHGYSVRCVKDK